MKDKNGVDVGWDFIGEYRDFSGVLKRDNQYYVPLGSGSGNRTKYYKFDDNEARFVHHNKGYMLDEKQMKDVNDQRSKK